MQLQSALFVVVVAPLFVVVVAPPTAVQNQIVGVLVRRRRVDTVKPSLKNGTSTRQPIKPRPMFCNLAAFPVPKDTGLTPVSFDPSVTRFFCCAKASLRLLTGWSIRRVSPGPRDMYGARRESSSSASGVGGGGGLSSSKVRGDSTSQGEG